MVPAGADVVEAVGSFAAESVGAGEGVGLVAGTGLGEEVAEGVVGVGGGDAAGQVGEGKGIAGIVEVVVLDLVSIGDVNEIEEPSVGVQT